MGPTISDIGGSGVVVLAKEADFDLALYPNIITWMAWVEKRKGFKPPYELLPLRDIA